MYLNPQNVLGFTNDYAVCVNGNFLHHSQFGIVYLDQLARTSQNIFLCSNGCTLINFNHVVSLVIETNRLVIHTVVGRVNINMELRVINELREWMTEQGKKYELNKSTETSV